MANLTIAMTKRLSMCYCSWCGEIEIGAYNDPGAPQTRGFRYRSEELTVPTFAPSVLHSFARSLFVAGGVPGEEAEVVAGSLVDANLCGHDSHGLIRIPQYLRSIRDGKMKPGVPLTILKDTPAVLVADGGWGLGQVQAHRLLAGWLPRRGRSVWRRERSSAAAISAGWGICGGGRPGTIWP